MYKSLKITLILATTAAFAAIALWIGSFSAFTPPTHEDKLAGWISAGIIVAIGLVLAWLQSRRKTNRVK